MPLSNDNQDYGASDEKNKENTGKTSQSQNDLNTDDLKGKKVDADLETDSDKPSEEKK